jgi:hypothetical protein
MAIDGRGIQSERLRDLRLHQHRFAEFEVFFFVPEPRRRGASEAFISAREKQRVLRQRASDAPSAGWGKMPQAVDCAPSKAATRSTLFSARSSRTTS